jgi:DNA-binding MarR family transcriptional regulator
MGEGASTEYAFSEQIGHLLRRAYQRHTAIFQSTVPDDQLTATHFVVLLTVRKQPGAGVPAIARATALDEASVRAMVERLKWRRLVDAAHEPGDARDMKVTLTDAGSDLVAKIVPYAFDVSAKTLAPLNESERAVLLGLLRRIAGFDDKA